MERDADGSKPDDRRPTYRLADAQLAVDVASGKWVLPILELLAARSLRRSELRRLLGGDTHQKVLSLTLQRMTAAGLISRTVLRPTPPAVRYELTGRGRDFFVPLAAMAAWAAADRDRLSDAVNHADDAPGAEIDDDEPQRPAIERRAHPPGMHRSLAVPVIRHAASTPASGVQRRRPALAEHLA